MKKNKMKKGRGLCRKGQEKGRRIEFEE